MKYSLIAFDLDGTLLRDDKSISRENLDALRAAADRGMILVPATGRIFRGVPDAVCFIPGMRYYITCNGAHVYDAIQGTTLFSAEIDNALAVRLMEHMDTLDVVYDCYKNSWGYVSREMYERAAEYIGDEGIAKLFYRTRSPVVPDLKTFIIKEGGGIQKTQMFFRDPRARKRELELLPKLFPEVAVSSAVATNIEINSRDASKGAALTALCEKLGIPMERVAAFGDGTNDIGMLRAAGLGVAMGNADFFVQAAADAVTEDNERNGFAMMMEKLLAGD